jgi:glycosyltransferase involved in cell wall biosynthesis
MKISVFGTRGFPLIQGGVERHCENLYPRIAKRQTHVTVYRRKPYILRSQNVQYPGITFIDLPSTRIKGFEALWHSLLSTVHILLHRTDLVHIHNIGPALFTPVLRLFKKKVVLTYHSPNYEHKKWNKTERGILKISEKAALKYAHKIIFVNHFQMEKYPVEIRQKSTYIPNGINQPIFSHSSGHLKKWGLENTKYILSVGRITPEKGFDILIKAFAAIDPDYKLVIAGGIETETNYYRRLTRLTDNNKIIFTGFIYGEALQQLYTHAQLFVMPSYHEGFPLVLLEAMSYRLPLIVSDIPATHLVRISPQCYFPAGDINALINKLTDYIQKEPLQKPTCDLSAYDWDKIAEQTLEVYRNALLP